MAGITSTVIYIDPRDKSIHYYATPEGQNRVVHETRNYRTRDFDPEFYSAFSNVLTEFFRKYPPSKSSATSIVLPDNAFFSDTINLPAMKARNMATSLTNTMNGMYKNRSELTIQTFQALQNKQFAQICLTGVRNVLLNDIKAACTAAHLVAQNVTFAAEATAIGLVTLNAKLKNDVFLFMDVKETFTRLVYVFKGRAVGSTMLPFGYEIISRPKPVAEDMLFDHPVAELAVLNAREKAKAKTLTVMDEGSDAAAMAEGAEGEEGSTLGSGEQTNAINRIDTTIKVLPKKVPRRLPKFMQRPIPETSEEMANENFRVFVKWALCFLGGNERLAALGGVPTVYINMPKEFEPVVTAANAEKAENGVEFVIPDIGKQDDTVARQLEMYGGLFVTKGKSHNIF